MKEAGRAEQIIDLEVRNFCTKMQSREVTPLIIQLRDNMEKLRRDEIERQRRLLRDLPPEQAVDQITESLMNKILHHAISQLKENAHDPQAAEFTEVFRKIFNIKPQ
jgi:glutamyl-tRNA reductase